MSRSELMFLCGRSMQVPRLPQPFFLIFPLRERTEDRILSATVEPFEGCGCCGQTRRLDLRFLTRYVPPNTILNLQRSIGLPRSIRPLNKIPSSVHSRDRLSLILFHLFVHNIPTTLPSTSIPTDQGNHFRGVL